VKFCIEEVSCGCVPMPPPNAADCANAPGASCPAPCAPILWKLAVEDGSAKYGVDVFAFAWELWAGAAESLLWET